VAHFVISSWSLVKRAVNFYLVHLCALISLFHIKTDLRVLFTPLGLCYSMFQPRNGQPPGVRPIHFHSKVNKICTTCKLQFSERLVFHICSIFLSHCGNVSVIILEDGPLRAETCRGKAVLIKWYE
jgi:hypothetical protein